MEEEDEVAIACSTSWSAVEGSLERSVCVARENGEVGKPCPTSRLVLVAPAGETGPCELTVTFQRNSCRVRQIYVLSNARTVEIYGQLEEDSEAEYVSTMRGELASFPEDDIFTNRREDCKLSFPDSSEQPTGETGPFQSDPLSSSREINSNLKQVDAQNVITIESETGGSADEWKEELLTSNGSSSGRRDYEEESFQSLSDGVPGKMVEAGITFDEALDQTEWVECPHSPMKSSAVSSDDDVDINKCGFFLVDSDGDKQAVQHASSHFSAGTEDAAAANRDAASECSGGSENEQQLAQGQFTEVQERSQPPTSLSTRGVIGSAGGSDEFSEPREVPNVQSPRNHCGIPHHNDSEASSRAYFTGVVDSTGQCPVYEAERNLTNTDAWRSVKIRLLSLKDKSKLVLHKVIIKVVPGNSTAPLTKSAGTFGSFQQSAGSSSLLAMLGPGIFQMARGLAESRKVNSLGLISGERKLPESKIFTSPDSTNVNLSVLSSGVPTSESTPSRRTSSSFEGSDRQKDDPSLGEETDASPLAKETYPTVSHSLQDEPCRAGKGLGKDSRVPVTTHDEESPFEFDQSEVIQSKDTKNAQSEKLEDFGRGNDRELSDEVAKRLDRLEAICLRMESNLTSTLENIDRRLKVLEVDAMERRMPGIGKPFWGAGYESGPFVSATSVNLPPVQTGKGTGSVLDKQTHSSTSAPTDSPAEQLSRKGVASSADPFYPGLLSSTSPSLLSSVSLTLPLWPLSFPKHVSSDSNSGISSNTTSTHSRDGHVDELVGSCQGQEASVKAEEIFPDWGSRFSDDSGSEMSSDSEHTFYADNTEEPGQFSCPESVSSSPSKPDKRVKNPLASGFLAFSAPFDCPTAVVKSPKQKDSFQGEVEDTAEEDSFNSEEQAPLVDFDCFTLGVEDGSAEAKAGEVFMQGYEAIPVSREKEYLDMIADELNEEVVFWASEVEGPDKGSQIDWQSGLVESQDEKNYSTTEELDQKVGNNLTGSKAIPDLLDTPSVMCMEDVTTYNLFPTGFEGLHLQEERLEDLLVPTDGMRLEASEHEKLAKPFFQEIAIPRDGDILTPVDSWGEEWEKTQVESEDNNVLTYLTVRGFDKPLDPHKEMLLQEEFFADEEWDWFTSGVLPSMNKGFSPDSLMGSGCLNPGANVPTIVDPPAVDHKPELSVGHNEPRSLLDEDITVVGDNNQFRMNVFSKDWAGEKTLWPLLDEDLSNVLTVKSVSDEYHLDDWLPQRDQRSLLDQDIFIPPQNFMSERAEDIFIPPRNISNERTESFSSAGVSPEEQYDLSGIIKPPKCTDTVLSLSSHTSGSNLFEDDCRQRSDLNLETRDFLENFFEETHEFEVSESERTQSLLFHLSL